MEDMNMQTWQPSARIVTAELISEVKQKMLGKLNIIERDGVKDLVDYLCNKTDYFSAPAAAKYHNNIDGGLLIHSDNVRGLLELKNKQYKLGLSEDTIDIVGYMHDLCKCNTYKKSMKLKKDDAGKWIGYSIYEYDEELPLGHGEKSLSILQDFIKVTDEEKIMIVYHMGLGLPKERYSDFDKALTKYPRVLAVHTADYEASRFYEKNYDPVLYTIEQYNAFMKGTFKI